jgi:hypothetical protein
MHHTHGFQWFRVAVLVFMGFFIFFENPAAGMDLSLAWNPNSEADLAGYGVYSRKGADGPPYDLLGYIAVEELQDRNNPSFTVTGLERGFDYYFAATAYDTAGNESYFSGSACARVGDSIELCGDTGSGTGGDSGSQASGGGSGGGCFIRTVLP